MVMTKQPVVVVVRNPLLAPRPEDVYEVALGASIADLVPDTDADRGKPVVCSIAGTEGYILRKDWGYPVQPGDIIVFEVDPPRDREALRGVLMIVIAVVATFIGGPAGAGAYGAGYGAAAGAGFAIAANLALNALLPMKQAEMHDPQSASPTYSTALSGNIARLDQPIPRICGRHKVTPPFAAQPYLEYINNDAYYYAVFAVGIGNHEIESVLIDDTSLSHFADVLTSRYLAPGEAPLNVLANVATAPEVAGQDMATGRYVGGFAACAPLQKASAIGIDILAPRGLGAALDDGSMGITTIEWRVEVRPIDDFGVAVGPWTLLAAESRTMSTVTPQRWSYKYTLATIARVEIRVIRTNLKNDNARYLNDAVWGGLRAYLSAPAPMHPDCAHYEIVLRASDQLSALSQRNISMVVLAKVRTWSPDTGWTAETHTRNPAWWLADLWSSGVWGEGLPDSRIDLLTLYDLSLIWEARQDRFDFVFDSSMDAWEAAQLIAGAGRARCFRRYGVNTLARDQLEILPVTAFTPRNCVTDSMALNETLPLESSPDGVILEYFNNRSWSWEPIECPCPGVEEMVNPVRHRKVGITGSKHAEREGMYEAASMLYRTRRVVCTTEMQGILPAYMSPVRWQPEIVGYGQSGDVAHWDEDTLILGLTEPVTWGADPNYLTLIRDDGTLTTPVAVTPGPSEYEVTLPEIPDFDLILDDARRERPKYLVGPLEDCDELVKISAISDGGKDGDAQLFSIEAVIDDERVHAADNALLPGPGDIQDPIDPAELPPDTYFVNINNSDGLYGPEGNSLIYGHVFKDNGVEQIETSGVLPSHMVDLTSQWLIGSPHEPEVAELFEIFVTADHALRVGSDTTGVWLSLGTTRSFLGEGSSVSTTLVVQIREVSTGIVQDVATKVIQGIPGEGEGEGGDGGGGEGGEDSGGGAE